MSLVYCIVGGLGMAVKTAYAVSIVDTNGDSVTVLKTIFRADLDAVQLIDSNYCDRTEEYDWQQNVGRGMSVTRHLKKWNCAFQVARHPLVNSFPIRGSLGHMTVDGQAEPDFDACPVVFAELLVKNSALSAAVNVGFSQGADGGLIETFPISSLLPFRVAVAPGLRNRG